MIKIHTTIIMIMIMLLTCNNIHSKYHSSSNYTIVPGITIIPIVNAKTTSQEPTPTPIEINIRSLQGPKHLHVGSSSLRGWG